MTAVTAPVRRPRPGPGRSAAYRVAPPVADAFGPWAAILEDAGATGELRWEMGPDGVLLPTRDSAGNDAVRTRGRALRDRLAALARR